MAFVYAEQASWNSRKSVALMVAIGVNVGFLAAMQSGLMFEAVKEPPRISVVPVDPDPKPEPRPIPAPEPYRPEFPAVQEPPVWVPRIEVEEPPPVGAPPMIRVGESAGSGPGVTPAPAIRQLQANHPLTEPEYPAVSIRRNEEGTVRLLIHVLPDGRVADVKLDRSSGHPLLDKAAIAAARKHWTFKPAAQGGTPIAAWGYFTVTFTLKD